MFKTPCMAVETSRELFNTILQSGISQGDLISESGVTVSDLQQSESRYPVGQHLKLWQAADKLLPFSGIGLQMGAHSDPYKRGIVGLLFAASPDLKTAVTNKYKYTKILADHVGLQIEETEKHFSIIYSIEAKYFHSYEIERVFSGFLNWVRVFAGEAVCPERISCQFAAPAHAKQYQKRFNCPIYFNQNQNSIVFDKQLYLVENAQFNDYLYAILQARADKILSELDNRVDFINGVRSLIAGRLAKGHFSAEDIACSYHMSKRTFYRKLQDEGTSYQLLLDDERKKMALSYLQVKSCQLHNVAFLLGYADQRGFSRAFKRWMNCTPAQYLMSV